MFPGIYDFRWDIGHIVFLGVFYSVLAVVLTTMVIALRRALLVRAERIDSLRWHTEFEDLPSNMRRCRHELAGEIESRECPNGFDCRHCEEHPRFLAARTTLLLAGEPRVAGFELPNDRLYHRGHTWVRQENDGTMTIGLDDFASHLLGPDAQLRLPEQGSDVKTNGVACDVTRNGTHVRVLSPIDGKVIGTGSPTDDWLIKVWPYSNDTRHLLTPAEAKAWMLREVERLQMTLAPESVGASLADGGTPVDDLSLVIPQERLDDVYGMVFLHP